MDIHYPLTIYFDASCRLCNSEMQNIKVHDTKNQLVLVDCSSPDFVDTACKTNNISQASIAKLWGNPLTRRMYPWVVMHRYTLSKIGLPELFGLLSKHTARKAEKRSRLCSEGRCNISD